MSAGLLRGRMLIRRKNELLRKSADKEKECASGTSSHMWLADGDSLMCYIVRMSRLIA